MTIFAHAARHILITVQGADEMPINMTVKIILCDGSPLCNAGPLAIPQEIRYPEVLHGLPKRRRRDVTKRKRPRQCPGSFRRLFAVRAAPGANAHGVALKAYEGDAAILECQAQLGFRRAVNAVALPFVVADRAPGDPRTIGQFALGPVQETPRRATEGRAQKLLPVCLTHHAILTIMTNIDHI